jgi:hypothetical protein
LHLLPDHDLVLVALGNGPGSPAAATAMVDEAVKALTGLEPPPPPVIPEPPEDVDLSPYAGRYESPGVTTLVEARDGELRLAHLAESSGPGAARQLLTMKPIGDHQFVGPLGQDGRPSGGCTFLDVADGRAGYLWMARVSRRVD